MSRPSNTLDAARIRDRRLRSELSPALDAALAGRIVRRPGTFSPRRRNLHFCVFDRECRLDGAPRRIYASLFDWGLIVALTPSARMSRSPGTFSLFAGWVQLDRGPSRTCHNLVGLAFSEHASERLLSAFSTCPLGRGHRGAHLEWRSGRRTNVPLLDVSPLVVGPLELSEVRALERVVSLDPALRSPEPSSPEPSSPEPTSPGES